MAENIIDQPEKIPAPKIEGIYAKIVEPTKTPKVYMPLSDIIYFNGLWLKSRKNKVKS